MRIVKCAIAGAMLLLIAVLSVPTAAGGWATATLDRLPTFVAGQETAVGFVLRQHGNTPISGISPSDVIFSNARGERLTFPARDEGARGHYLARVTLPTTGAWEWKISSFGEHPMPPITVTATPVAPRDDTASLLPRWLTAAAIMALALIALGGLILGFRWRGQSSRPASAHATREPQPAV